MTPAHLLLRAAAAARRLRRAAGVLVLVLGAALLTTTEATAAAPAPTTVSFTPNAVVQLPYTSTLMARDRWQVLSSTLKHSDGTAGSVSVREQSGYAQFPIGTITDQPAVFDSDAAALSVTAQTLILTADADTTGTVTLAYSLAPEPAPIAVPLGAGQVVTMPVAHQNQVLTVPTVAGTSYLLSVSGASFVTSNPGGYTTSFSLRAPGAADWQRTGYSTSSAYLADTVPATSMTYVAAVTGDLTVFVDPSDDATGGFTLAATVLPDVVTPIQDGVPVTATATGGSQRLVFTHPGTASGALPGFRIEPVQLATIPGRPFSFGPNNAVTLEQGGQVVATLGGLVNGVAFDYPPPSSLPGLDGTKPWQLVVTTAYNTTGSITVRLDLPTVTLAAVRSGSPVRVTFTRSFDYTRLTFTPKTGQRVMVRLTANTAGAAVEVVDATGASLPAMPTTDEWQGYQTASTPGPLALVVRTGGGVGAVVVTLLLVTDPVYAIADGQQRTITWTTEQNPTITFVAPAPQSFLLQRLALEVTRTGGTGWGSLTPILVQDAYGNTEALPTITEGAVTVSQSSQMLTAGPHTILLDPPTSASGSITVRLRIVTDVTWGVSSGQPHTFAVTTPEQVTNVNLQAGTTGKISWEINGSTLPLTMTYRDYWTGAVTTVSVPKGHGEGALTVTPSSFDTYWVLLKPVGLTTGTFTITLKAR